MILGTIHHLKQLSKPSFSCSILLELIIKLCSVCINYFSVCVCVLLLDEIVNK